MSRLFLLRHARAAWAEPGMRDFDRPLDPTGAADARRMGLAMAAAGHVPARVICSTARRARETWDLVSQAMRVEAEVAFSEALYNSDAARYLEIARQDGSEPLLLVGHNPMIEDLCLTLSDGGGEADRARSGGYPAGALAVIDFPGRLAEAAASAGKLAAFITPADLAERR
jgi:phosphohistidine phosphatase